MMLALLQELLMALRANDADGYKSWQPLALNSLVGMWLLRSSRTGWGGGTGAALTYCTWGLPAGQNA